MGLISQILEHVSIPWTIGALIGGYTVYYIAGIALDELKISRRGARPPKIKYKLPFGIDFAYDVVCAVNNRTNMEHWHKFLGEVHSWTGEARIGGTRFIFTADPANVKAILATQFTDFGKGDSFNTDWHDFLGDSIFTTDGDLWHTSRQLIRPQFIRDRISDLHTFERHLRTLHRAIANGGPLSGEHQSVYLHAAHGRVVDVSDLFFRYTLDVITEFLLGQNVKSLCNPHQGFAEAFNEVQRIQALIAGVGPWSWLIPRRKMKAMLKIVNAFIMPHVNRALELPPEELAQASKTDRGYTFLHAVAAHTRDRRVLRDQIISVLLAGRDTTAATLSWAIYELARHPEVVTCLRAEILAVVGPEREPTYDNLKSMRFLTHVLNETLRLYPAVPFNVRVALRDTTLPSGGGLNSDKPVLVCRNTHIIYSPLVLQRRADLYPRASTRTQSADPLATMTEEPLPPVDEFAPERWSRWQPRPWEYIPFNGGPRICLGQQFALVEMGYVLTRLFQRFERVESHMGPIDGGKPDLVSQVVLAPGQGVHVAFFEPEKPVF